MNLIDKIKELSSSYQEEVIKIRRHIHQHPELSFQEIHTSEFISSKLAEYGITHKTGIAGNGIIGHIKGLKTGKNKVVGLRADIDALPIIERTSCDFSSRNKGVMHACGHDAHIASLLGTAKILKALESEFSGTVTLIFQPAEEKSPGGAKEMLKENIFGKKEPMAVIAQHVMPELETGSIGIKSGIYMASVDDIYFVVKGKGGHAALPHEIIDPIVVTSEIIIALQKIVSRYANPAMPTVLSFGNIEAKGETNVIPDKVKVRGTFRTMDDKWRKKAHKNMKNIAKSIALASGAECKFKIVKGYPYLKNDAKIVGKIKDFASQYIGIEKINDLSIEMTAEDFAYFTRKYPSAMYRTGIKGKHQDYHPLHSPYFEIDEGFLETSSGLMAWLAVSFLASRQPVNA